MRKILRVAILPFLWLATAPAVVADLVVGADTVEVKDDEFALIFDFDEDQWEAIVAAVVLVEPRPDRVLAPSQPCLDAGGTADDCPLVEKDQPLSESEWAANELARRFFAIESQILSDAAQITDRIAREATAAAVRKPEDEGFGKRERESDVRP